MIANITNQEAFMSHRNARLTPRGRLLLVQRVAEGMPVAHVAKAMGVSRQCAHRWVRRFAEGGPAGLEDRSSRPRRCPAATDPERVARVLEARERERCGPAPWRPSPGCPSARSLGSCAVTGSRPWPSATR